MQELEETAYWLEPVGRSKTLLARPIGAFDKRGGPN
jgi:hypothetical protein